MVKTVAIVTRESTSHNSDKRKKKICYRRRSREKMLVRKGYERA